MAPTGAWPILILRGASQPTPNAPEAPRAIGVCLNISNAHVHRYFHIFYTPPFALKILVKTLRISAPLFRDGPPRAAGPEEGN